MISEAVWLFIANLGVGILLWLAKNINKLNQTMVKLTLNWEHDHKRLNDLSAVVYRRRSEDKSIEAGEDIGQSD